MTESELQSDVMRYLRSQPDFHPIRIILGRKGRRNSSGKAGTADLLGLGPEGRMFAVEVKTEHGIVSDEQADFLALVNRLGGYGIVARSLEDVREMVRRMRGQTERRRTG